MNSVTKSDSFPLPRIKDYIDQVGVAKFVSKFDLLKGYWQVPLSERARVGQVKSPKTNGALAIHLPFIKMA